MNQTLDMFFLRKKLMGKNYKLNLKPKYFKIMKKQVIFYLICNYLSREELFELYWSCRTFKQLIQEDIELENKILKYSIVKLKERYSSSSTKDKEKDKGIPLSLLNEAEQSLNRLKFYSINSKLKEEKYNKLRELDNLLSNGGITISSNDGKKLTVEPIYSNNDKSDKDKINLSKAIMEEAKKTSNDNNNIRLNNNFLNEQEHFNISFNALQNKTFDINSIDDNYFINNDKNTEIFKQQLNKVLHEKAIYKYQNQNNKYDLKPNYQVLREKLKQVPSLIYKNIIDIKEMTFEPELYALKNIDISKLSGRRNLNK